MNEELTWVASSCTLPTPEQPIREAEFDQLFASAVQAATRIDPTHLELTLDAAALPEAKDLTVRETSCCSFFTFTFSPVRDGQVTLGVGVPPAYVAVLDAFSRRVSALTPGVS